MFYFFVISNFSEILSLQDRKKNRYDGKTRKKT
jgi:hypothetical protein